MKEEWREKEWGILAGEGFKGMERGGEREDCRVVGCKEERRGKGKLCLVEGGAGDREEEEGGRSAVIIPDEKMGAEGLNGCGEEGRFAYSQLVDRASS